MKATGLFRVLVHWHRWVGLAAAFFIVWLVITGVLIHHAADFGLESEPVRAAWILDHYRIGDPDVISFEAGGRRISQSGKSLYLDRERIAALDEPLTGVVNPPGLLLAAGREQLLIFDERGQRIETVRAEHGLPSGIRGISLQGKRIVLDTQAGWYEADPNEMQWRPARGMPRRATPSKPPDVTRAAIVQDARSREISRERVLRDLHSGSFFGTAGKWVIDIAALALLLLSISGIWIWVRARREFGGKTPAKSATRDRVRGKLSS